MDMLNVENGYVRFYPQMAGDLGWNGPQTVKLIGVDKCNYAAN
jgi:hypothetical protein